MKGRHEIFFDDDRLCIEIARGTGVLKGYEIPRNKQSALLYHSAQMIEIDWQSVQMVGDDRCCLVFCPNEHFKELPVSAFELCGTLRPRCFELLKSLSHAIEEAGDRLYWNMDSVPLSNIWFFSNGDILLLSGQMGDALDMFELDEDRFWDKEAWYAHNCAEGFGKAHYLCQLLYYSLTTVVPFASPVVRENGFQAVPMNLLLTGTDEQTAGLGNTVDKAISDDRKFQLTQRHPLAFFRNLIDGYVELTPARFVPGYNPEIEAYKVKSEKRARRKAFFRKKGFITAMIILAALIVGSIAGWAIWRAVKPPLTKDLDEVEIIEYYYDALTNLDVGAMDEPLKYGYSGPDMVQVSTIYVTSTVQKSYEGQSNVVDPRQWIADGMGPLPQGSIVYGVSDVKVQQLDEDVFRATITSWSSENYLDETNTLVSDSGMDIYRYTEVVDFTFTSRGTWREIAKIEKVDMTLDQVYHVDYL
jgi:hypothetical protein